MNKKLKQHIAEVEQQIVDGEALALQLRGRVSLIDADLATMQKHLAVLKTLAQEDGDGVAN